MSCDKGFDAAAEDCWCCHRVLFASPVILVDWFQVQSLKVRC